MVVLRMRSASANNFFGTIRDRMYTSRLRDETSTRPVSIPGFGSPRYIIKHRFLELHFLLFQFQDYLVPEDPYNSSFVNRPDLINYNPSFRPFLVDRNPGGIISRSTYLIP